MTPNSGVEGRGIKGQPPTSLHCRGQGAQRIPIEMTRPRASEAASEDSSTRSQPGGQVPELSSVLPTSHPEMTYLSGGSVLSTQIWSNRRSTFWLVTTIV